ncbi:hypothetical protein COO60DRAFT_724447, partial [Scenedesmus sp. NREL 46B-D3]
MGALRDGHCTLGAVRSSSSTLGTVQTASSTTTAAAINIIQPLRPALADGLLVHSRLHIADRLPLAAVGPSMDVGLHQNCTAILWINLDGLVPSLCTCACGGATPADHNRRSLCQHLTTLRSSSLRDAQCQGLASDKLNLEAALDDGLVDALKHLVDAATGVGCHNGGAHCVGIRGNSILALIVGPNGAGCNGIDDSLGVGLDQRAEGLSGQAGGNQAQGVLLGCRHMQEISTGCPVSTASSTVMLNSSTETLHVVIVPCSGRFW